MKNENWYYYDINTGMLKINETAPEKAQKSYQLYLKDQEHNKKLMYGLISEEDDEKYQVQREKIEQQLQQENLEDTQNEEQNIVKNLFGV